jgi:hypothetical protein
VTRRDDGAYPKSADIMQVGSRAVPGRRRLALLFALQRAAGSRELAERLDALILLVLWAQIAAAGRRNDRRAPWMRTAAPTRPRGPVRRARDSISGRRARG